MYSKNKVFSGVRQLVSVVTGVSIIALSFPAAAATLSGELLPLLSKHERVVAAKQDMIASKRALEEAVGAWLPTVDLTFNKGQEVQKKPAAADTDEDIQNFELSATQLIYDFGKTGSSIDTAKLTLDQSKLSLETVKQGLVMEAAQAYVNLFTTIKTLSLAKQSENNIRKQTGMEQARVDRGSGFSSDVLQSKAQLAGAQANRIRSQGALINAMDRYRNVFRTQKIKVKELKKPQIPNTLIPKTLKSAIEISKKKNLGLRASAITVKIAKQNIRSKRSAFAPKVEGIADYKRKHNDGGVLGNKDVTIGKIELTWPLINGGKDLAGYRKSFNSLSAAEKRHTDATYATEERVRTAWQSLETSKLNAMFLRNQANISGEFLALARKERKLGTRSLLDVLSGETSYISSISAAVSAESARDLGVYNLLFAMGTLGIDNVESSKKLVGSNKKGDSKIDMGHWSKKKQK